MRDETRTDLRTKDARDAPKRLIRDLRREGPKRMRV